MIFTELTFLDNDGYEDKRTLKGDKIDFILKRLSNKKTKNNLVCVSTYNDDNFETIKQIKI